MGSDDFDNLLGAYLADSTHRWWAMVALAGMHGVHGDDWGKKFGGDVLPSQATRVAIDPGCKA
ncbi:hypothetical protein FB472_1843 [Rhodoglobus vestalii]|uniref:Uncharacterized protein n=1 Tax=Rhodoglobus vestalii TaxID=193384 RepID=A0A8H2K6S0_9MICO|nr:hypothetical protein FB472_1843 [Rhodoglobus vestalii]